MNKPNFTQNTRIVKRFSLYTTNHIPHNTVHIFHTMNTLNQSKDHYYPRSVSVHPAKGSQSIPCENLETAAALLRDFCAEFEDEEITIPTLEKGTVIKGQKYNIHVYQTNDGQYGLSFFDSGILKPLPYEAMAWLSDYGHLGLKEHEGVRIIRDTRESLEKLLEDLWSDLSSIQPPPLRTEIETETIKWRRRVNPRYRYHLKIRPPESQENITDQRALAWLKQRRLHPNPKYYG